jgi:hypothetical protein
MMKSYICCPLEHELKAEKTDFLIMVSGKNGKLKA